MGMILNLRVSTGRVSVEGGKGEEGEAMWHSCMKHGRLVLLPS